MDRNSILGLVIIGAILIIATMWNTPSKEELRQRQRQADSLAMVEQITKKIAQQTTETKTNEELNTSSNNKTELEKQAITDAYGDFAAAAEGTQQIFTIENDVMRLGISTKGGKPYAVELKEFKTHDQKPVYLFEGDSSIFGLSFFTQNNRSIATSNLYFEPLTPDTLITLNETDTAKTLSLRLNAGPNRYLEYTYTLRPKSYKVDFKMNFVNMQEVMSANTRVIDLTWRIYLPGQEKDKKNENTFTHIFYKYNQGEVDEFEISADEIQKSEILRNKVKWVAFKQQFFSSTIIAGTNFENATITAGNVSDSSYLKWMRSEMGLPFLNAKSQEIDLAFYFGPNHYQTLKKLGLEMEELVGLGSSIIKWINKYLIIPVFNFLNNYIGNYGIIILLLTIFIKLLLFPLTYKSYLSMAKMRVLKPQIDEINERIPADKPMERQQATMALYKKVGVNPLGGCLPLLLQMPILIAMFKFFPSSIELRQEGFLWVTDLSSYDAVITWTTHIPLISTYFGNHISMFNVLMTVTTIITMKMNNQVSTQQTIPGMKTMMYIMPVMFMFILNNFSSGLTYYYFLANVITIAQNEIFKRSIDENKLLHQLNEHKKKPVKKSSFQARLEEAAKKRGYKAPKK